MKFLQLEPFSSFHLWINGTGPVFELVNRALGRINILSHAKISGLVNRTTLLEGVQVSIMPSAA